MYFKSNFSFKMGMVYTQEWNLMLKHEVLDNLIFYFDETGNQLQYSLWYTLLLFMFVGETLGNGIKCCQCTSHCFCLVLSYR